MLAAALQATALALPNIHIPSLDSSTSTFPAYIESTDAFGVVFYSTYPVLLERALGTATNAIGARLKSVKTMRFKRPARLGDRLVFACQESGSVTCSNSVSGEELFSARKAELCRGIVSAEAAPLRDVRFRVHVSEYAVFPDEMQGCDGSAALTTRTVFNLFERARTDVLGGPASLMSAVSSSDSHVFVARISDYALVSDPPLSGAHLSLSVVSHTVPISHAAVDFFQQIELNGLLVARATVTCCCVDAASGLQREFDPSMRSLFSL